MTTPTLSADEHLAMALDHLEAAEQALTLLCKQSGSGWLRMEAKQRIRTAREAVEDGKFATSEMLELEN